MKIWLEVRILPREEILDVQGRAILKTLRQNSKTFKDCRFGKYIRLLIEAEDQKTATQKAKEAAQNILHNPLTETYEIKIL